MKFRSNISPVYFRELKSIFYSPVAYIVLFAFYVLASYFWLSIVTYFSQMSMAMMRQGGGVKMSELFQAFYGNVAVTFIFLLPLVSMRGFSEEKKAGTIETLFTYPLSDLDILLGKYFGMLTLLAAMIVPLLLFPLALPNAGSLHWPSLLAGFGGFFLVGAAFLSVGLLTSAMTENQVIAGALAFGAILLLFIIGWMEQSASGLWKELLQQLSIMNHFQDMTKGVLNLKDFTYFLLFGGLSLFSTLRLLESKKWR